VDTDSYTAFAVVGGAALYAAGRARDNPPWLVAAGLLSGLAAITRNDGVLLLGVLWLAALLLTRRSQRPFPWKYLLLGTAAFLLPWGGWTVRNVLVLGRPSAVPLSFLLTLRDYVQLFRVQPQADWAGFWSQGVGPFFSLRLDALVASLLVLVGDFQAWGLLPLLGIGLSLRRRAALWPAFLYLLVLFLALVIAFPLLVVHGTWSRSLTAFLPTGYACVALGLYRLTERLCHWRPTLPRRLLHGTFLALGGLVTVFIGLTAANAQLTAHTHPQTWALVGDWLREHSQPDEVIMAKDPMAVLLYGERRAIGLPYEEPPQLYEVMEAYDISKIVLIDDRGLTSTFQELYAAGDSQGRFVLLWQQEAIQVYDLDSPTHR
jgi:4-amino-4-deoxy-L-arabinose transferase-like glycosyltransferase